MALRIILDKPEKEKTSLWKMMREAVKKGLIKDKHFGHIMEQPLDSQSKPYVEDLPDAIAYLRNHEAHGSTALGPWSVVVLRICADIASYYTELYVILNLPIELDNSVFIIFCPLQFILHRSFLRNCSDHLGFLSF